MSFSLILLLAFSVSAFAQTKHIVVMGGGGEPKGDTTIFDGEASKLGKYFAKNTDWKMEVSFNGGHAKTEKILADGIGKMAGGSTSFTEKEYLRVISDYEEKIKSGTIKPGEQLLIYISTHGALKMSKEKTHSIATGGGAATDLNNLQGASIVSMDKLQSLADLAAEKGVKLGIIDGSCHSGASIPLKNDKTCVITASGPKHFGYSSYGERFASNMKKGKNLEQVFLETFSGRNETSFPMISSPVGMKLQEDLYSLITPFLYSYDDNHDKLKEYLEKEVMDNKCAEAEESFNKIIALSKDMEATLNGKKSDFAKFRQDLTDYFQYQNKIRNDLVSMNLPALDTKEKVCSDFKNGTTKANYCMDYSLKEILSMDFDAELKRYEEMKKQPGPKNGGLGWIEFTISNYEKMKIKKTDLLLAHPEYGRYQNYYKDEIPKFEQESWSRAMNVSKSLQNVYTKSYKALAKDNQETNPCKDFVL